MSPAQEIKERSVPSSAVFQQLHTSGNQLESKESVSASINVSCPQIIHIAPVVGEQHYILHNAGDPPIQLLLQRPETVTGGVIPLLQNIPVHTPVKTVAADGPNSIVAPVTQKKERQRDNNLKRPQKIKTRSGRVSRPPKYKVKDYKFIKRADLADGHQSDSDDYSEISIEEEEGEEGKLNVGINFNLNNKAFKCETCEKAYIGNGGLSRHYKLNPTHKSAAFSQESVPAFQGQQNVTTVTSRSAMPSDSQSGKNAEGESTAALSTGTGTQNTGCALTSAAQVSDQPDAPKLTSSTSATSEAPNNQMSVAVTVEAPVCTAQKHGPGRPKGPGRPGRPKIAARRARRGRPGRPPKHFGGTSMEQQTERNKAWLKEVLQQCSNEDLMEMVLPRLAKVMTVWEFLLLKVEKGCPSRPQFSDVYREFQQLHHQVKKMAQDSTGVNNGHEFQRDMDVNDSQEIKTLPPAKRFKLEKAIMEISGVCVDKNETPKGVEEEQFLSSKKDSDFDLKETQSPAFAVKESAMETCHARSLDTTVNSGDQHAHQESKSPLPVMDKQSTQELHTELDAAALSPQVVFTTFETDITPEVTVQEQPSDSTETSDPSQKADDTTVDTDPSNVLLEVSENCESCQEMETSEVLSDSDITDHMQQQEQALGTVDLLPDHSYRISIEESQQPGERVNGLEHGCSLGNDVSLGSTVELQMQESSQKSYQDKILIHTECGLIMHHTEDCLASERIVIVTDVDGAHEEVPLETVQALLGIESSQNDGVLVSETQH